MVLIGDIVGDDEAAVARATSEVVRIANARGGEGFVAVSAEARKQVLARPRAHRGDRQPHQRVQDQRGRGDPAAAAGRLHRRHRAHQHRAVDREQAARWSTRSQAFLRGELPLGKTGDADLDRLSRAEMLGDRREQARELIALLARALAVAAEHLDASLAAALRLRARRTRRAARHGRTASSTCCRTAAMRVSWKRELRAPLERIFAGGAFAPCWPSAEAIHKRVLRGPRVRRAAHARRRRQRAHQHPGQLRRLRDAAARPTPRSRASCRSPATSDGVISGEHGIGITKLEFLTDDETAGFRGYKSAVDPEGRFNKGKLLPGGDLRNAYTPSFNLIGHESLIMQQTDIGVDLRRDQGLPALRQVQAGVRDARAARQPALLPAQQDPRHLAADRGLPLRGADAPRRLDRATGTSSPTSPTTAPSATSASRPARWTSTSATSRWRCATCCAAWARSSFNPGTAASMFFLNATRPADDQAGAQADDRLGLQGAAPRPPAAEDASAQAQTRRAARHHRQAADHASR